MTRTKINIDNRFNGVRHIFFGKGWAKNPANLRRLTSLATKGNLKMFNAFLIDAKNANIGCMMVCTGIDAA